MLTPHTRVDKVGARLYLDVYLLHEKTLEAALRPFKSAKYSFKYLSTEQPSLRRGCRAGRCRVSSCLRSQPLWAFRNHPLVSSPLFFSPLFWKTTCVTRNGILHISSRSQNKYLGSNFVWFDTFYNKHSPAFTF